MDFVIYNVFFLSFSQHTPVYAFTFMNKISHTPAELKARAMIARASSCICARCSLPLKLSA